MGKQHTMNAGGGAFDARGYEAELRKKKAFEGKPPLISARIPPRRSDLVVRLTHLFEHKAENANDSVEVAFADARIEHIEFELKRRDARWILLMQVLTTAVAAAALVFPILFHFHIL